MRIRHDVKKIKLPKYCRVKTFVVSAGYKICNFYYCAHHNNDIAFLLIVLEILLLRYVEVWASILMYMKLVWAQSQT